MHDEFDDFYKHFYTDDERNEIDAWETEEELFLCLDRSMQRIMPWLSKRGVKRTCPHVAGACRDILCCRGTEAVVVLANCENKDTLEDKEEEEEREKEKEKEAKRGGLIVGVRPTQEREKKRRKKKGKKGASGTLCASM
jgi:hypothetical protein